MDTVVHVTKPGQKSRRRRSEVKGENEHRSVVVPVDKWEGRLAQNDEGCVSEFNQLREDEYVSPESNRRHSVQILTRTKSIMEAMFVKVSGRRRDGDETIIASVNSIASTLQAYYNMKSLNGM